MKTPGDDTQVGCSLGQLGRRSFFMTMLAEGRVAPRSSPSPRSYKLRTDDGCVHLNGTTPDEAVEEAQTHLAGRYFGERQRRDMRVEDSTGNAIIARMYCLIIKEWDDDFTIGRFACVFIFFFATSPYDALLKAQKINHPGIHRVVVGPDGALDD